MKKQITILLILITTLTFSQKDPNIYDFFGGKSFGNKTVFYRLLFQIESGKVTGYAYTDEQGTQETKSLINGTFNPKTNTIIFSETKKLMTKARQNFNEMCYLSGVISIEINPKISKIKGDFIESTINGNKCKQGKIEIISPDAYSKLKETIKIEKEIAKAEIKKPIEKIVKKPIAAKVPAFKTDEKITIVDDEEVTIFWNSDKFVLDIWDDAIEDDDQITIQFNDEIILKEHTLKNRKESLTFDLDDDKENKIIFTATNTGFIANNTARVDLFDDEIKHQIITKLKLNKSVTVFLIKQK